MEVVTEMAEENGERKKGARGGNNTGVNSHSEVVEKDTLVGLDAVAFACKEVDAWFGFAAV